MNLERYRDLIPDWESFLCAARAPEPVCLRIRKGRAPSELVVPRLEALGFQLEPLTGLPDFFRVKTGPFSLSKTVEHWLGWFYIQECVMGLPGLALAPQPGERILDLCAAPGGKTSHLADLMNERGTVVAVEPSPERLRKLVANLYRLGHTAVLAIRADGRAFPPGASFDRVLVDAPCSAEGTLRKKGELPERPAKFVRHITRLQEALLRRAAALVRPGGVVLYATCTFDPAENEAVVNRVLRDLPLEVEPIDLPFPHAPGVTEFGGERFDPRLHRAWRVYPHHLDSGGLFMVRLRRTDHPPQPCSGWTPAESPDLPQWCTAAIEELKGNFEVPSDLVAALRWRTSGKTLWAHTCDALALDSWSQSRSWQFVSLGLPAFRRTGRKRPTNIFLRWLGAGVRSKGAALSRVELLLLLEGANLHTDLPDGEVALTLENLVVGRGKVRGGKLVAELGKEATAELHAILSAYSAKL